MKIYIDGKKVYICSVCYAEVYSLICRVINGEWIEVCFQCYQEEVKADVPK